MDMCTEYASKILYHPKFAHAMWLLDPSWQEVIVAEVTGMAAAGLSEAAVTRRLTRSVLPSMLQPADLDLDMIRTTEPREVLAAVPEEGAGRIGRVGSNWSGSITPETEQQDNPVPLIPVSTTTAEADVPATASSSVTTATANAAAEAHTASAVAPEASAASGHTDLTSAAAAAAAAAAESTPARRPLVARHLSVMQATGLKQRMYGAGGEEVVAATVSRRPTAMVMIRRRVTGMGSQPDSRYALVLDKVSGLL